MRISFMCLLLLKGGGATLRVRASDGNSSVREIVRAIRTAIALRKSRLPLVT